MLSPSGSLHWLQRMTQGWFRSRCTSAFSVSDHVRGARHEVLVVVAAADGALVDDHHPHLVHDVEHVGADWLLVQAGHVVVEALPVIHGLRPARVVGRRRQETREQVVGVRVVLGAGGLDAVVVRALDVVAAELDRARRSARSARRPDGSGGSRSEPGSRARQPRRRRLRPESPSRARRAAWPGIPARRGRSATSTRWRPAPR